MKARLIIADDHIVVRRGLRELLSGEPGLEVVAEAPDGVEAARLVRRLLPDLLILDIGMPGQRGLDVVEAMRADGVSTAVLIYTMHPMGPFLRRARRAGARGFVSKSASGAELLEAVRGVLAGRESFRPSHVPAGMNHPLDEDPFSRLSAREREVLRQLVKGVPLQRIAEQLHLSAKSISTYRRRLLDKAGVGSNAELVRLAALMGDLEE